MFGSKKRKAPSSSVVANDSSNAAVAADESDLLASLGSSLQNMDDYEQGILKTAELEQTPRLLAGGGSLGFPPSLNKSLAPSGRAISDLPHFQSVLSNIRQKFIQQPHNLTLLLQQQMLLNVIHTTTNDTDQCLRPQEELRHEQIRRRRFQRQRQKEDTIIDESSSSKPAAAAARPSTSIIHRNNGKADRKAPPKSALKTGVDVDEEEDAERTAAKRLEEIKQRKSVSFAASSASAAPRRRIGLQKRRRNAAKEKSNDDITHDEEETDEELKQRKEHLRKLREEREKKRQERRQRWGYSKSKTGASSSSSSSLSSSSRKRGRKKEESDDEEEAEFEFAENNVGEISSKQADTDPCAQRASQDEDHNTASAKSVDLPPTTRPSTASSPNAISTVKTACPLCQEDIEAPDQESMDESLSKHMSVCQTSRRRTRGQRQSTRRAAAANVISYVEESDDDDDDEQQRDNSKHDLKARASTSTRSRAKKVQGRNRQEDLEAFDQVEDDGEEEEEELVVDKLDDALSLDETASISPASLDDFEEEDYEDRVDDWIENGIVRMRVMKERDDEEVPPGEEVYEGGLVVPAWINDRLFPYQRTGLRWMWELHRQQAGGIIGDEMGLGKTVQLCAMLGSMAASRKLKSILVIAPATMLQHWLSEFKTWAPGIRRILIHQSAEAGGPILSSKRTISHALLRNVDRWLKDSRRLRLFEAIDEDDYNSRDSSSFCGTAYTFVTTYENVRRNPETWTNHPWSYIVMDEAQKIRNPDADITLVCKRLRTPHRLALSGTPIQNDLRELWSLFDFVLPGRLGTLPAFENEFANPIKRGGYSNASPMQVQLAYRCALVLRDLIKPYLLRRLKKDVKEVNRMPGKKEQVLFCRLSGAQRVMYEAFLQSDEVKQVLRGSIQMLGAITMLRKICNHPDLVCPPDQSSVDAFIQKGSFTDADLALDYSGDDDSMADEGSLTDRSGKLEVLAKILPLWKKQGHRVLIFCQWKKMLNIIQSFTESQGWKFGRLDGNTNVAARQRLVDNFNTDDSYFGMLMTTRTGGVGLNLTGADRIILYDPDWNPQTDAQARERAWRFGQEREVTIYRLITAGTVEEKIYQRQIFKTALSNRVLQDPRQRRLFSQKDLKDLFSLKVDGGSVISGSEGLTETGQLTKGQGYVDPDEEGSEDARASANDKDDGETMQSVLKSKGLAGIFDHDMVESNKSSKKASEIEMEENAKRVARAAARALKESVTEPQNSRFVAGVGPTGSSGLLASIRQQH